ncbi:hypothetical protein V6N13_095447 [Hibiscus sabdariffa]|uniref:Uncharacterized protein n=2 Tax=Hibiscus sabdariffa TaxID=183260 RepID=A0ABR2PRM6_9ROSI
MADGADSLGRFLFVSLISLSTLVVLFVTLRLYLSCVRRRQARRRRQAFLGRLNSLGLLTSGDTPLDPLIISSLPMLRFKQTTQVGGVYHNGKSTECSVCLTMLEDEDMTRVLPNCRHVFHAECIDKWLSLHSTCPLCRIEAKPRVKPEIREGPSMAIVDSSAEYFQRILSREGSISRVPLCGEEDEGRTQDLERQ